MSKKSKYFLFGIIIVFILIFTISKTTSQQKQKTQPSEDTSTSKLPPDTSLTKVAAGGTDSFASYTTSVPSDWEVIKESDEDVGTDKLILSKEGYRITISQGITNESLCFYPGDEGVADSSSTFDTFVQIDGKEGLQFRRSGIDGGTTFTICQKNDEGDYIQPTNFGHVNYSTLLKSNYSESILDEMDSIVASLEKSALF